MSGVTSEQARDFYRSAANFYRRSPWRSAGMDEPIKVECEQLGGGYRFAIVVGKKGKLKGLWLCEEWKTCLLFENGDDTTVTDDLQYTALNFVGRSQISPDELEVAQRLGFEVASPRTFRAVLRKDRGSDLRSPHAGELELLEACLWVIPDFIRRAKDRKPGRYEYDFKGIVGKMTLALSWVPREN